MRGAQPRVGGQLYFGHPKPSRVLCALSSLVPLARPREIRTAAIVRCKLLLSPFTFLNYTKQTKYEAQEKNAVSKPKMPQLGNLKYSRNSRKVPLYWEIFGLFIRGEIEAPVLVAERERFELAVWFSIAGATSRTIQRIRVTPANSATPFFTFWRVPARQNRLKNRFNRRFSNGETG